MNHTFKILEFDRVLESLKMHAKTRQAKEEIEGLEPYRSERKIRLELSNTTQARQMTELFGAAPIPAMEQIEEFMDGINRGELLSAQNMEQIGSFLQSVRRLKHYLEKGKENQISLAFYADEMKTQEELSEKIEKMIRNGKVDDYATKTLAGLRREGLELEEKIRIKAESALKANKAYISDSFVVVRNGRLCIPVKKQNRNKLEGAVVDQSSTGATVFIEPASVAKLREELELCKLMAEEEEKRILYTLAAKISEKDPEIRENIRVIIRLDFWFAKGVLSIDMDAVEPKINGERYIRLQKARHPMLEKNTCIPLDFEIGNEIRGVVITGPNTGGKTVAIKTVALLSMMAGCGMHVSALSADIAMNSQILCDIGDGQNMKDNLSTFSAHIRNILEILKVVNEESLVILDELGSGTDPAEGMGIAIAILEELRLSKALFLVTTHYPEVKEYAENVQEIINARMAFDRNSLKPLYRLELGKAGESCALYIALKLGMPDDMIKTAAKQAYGERAEELILELNLLEGKNRIQKQAGLRIQKSRHIDSDWIEKKKKEQERAFVRGDSVEVHPEKKIGIVVMPANQHGEVLVQIQKVKKLINQKRLHLIASAEDLYPEDYDFSIIFDTVENRKARHQMGKKHQENLIINKENNF